MGQVPSCSHPRTPHMVVAALSERLPFWTSAQTVLPTYWMDSPEHVLSGIIATEHAPVKPTVNLATSILWHTLYIHQLRVAYRLHSIPTLHTLDCSSGIVQPAQMLLRVLLPEVMHEPVGASTLWFRFEFDPLVDIPPSCERLSPSTTLRSNLLFARRRSSRL